MTKITLEHQDLDGEITQEVVELNLENTEFIEIDFINEVNLETDLHDLVVEKNPNYVTDISIVHNGGGRRKGSIAVYLEPWHADVLDFIDLRKNHGKEEVRARDLFLALWIPDLFMQRVQEDGDWALFDPIQVPGLIEAYDSDEENKFTNLFEEYESKNIGKKIKARELWAKILESQIETGTPYVLFKDAANKKSNQKNLGTIKSSNLCLVGETNLQVKFDMESNPISKSIKDVVNFINNEVDVYVLSKNIDNDNVEWKKITNGALMSDDAEIIKITEEESGFSIECTPEHQVYTKNRGYVLAKNLKESDVLDLNNKLQTN